MAEFPTGLNNVRLMIHATLGFDGRISIYCLDSLGGVLPIYHYIISEALSVPLRAIQSTSIFASADTVIEVEYSENDIRGYIAYEDIKRYHDNGYTKIYIPAFDTEVDILNLQNTYTIRKFSDFNERRMRHGIGR